MSERQLRARVNGGGDRLTMEHVGTLKNLQGVLLPTEEEPRGGGGDVDAEEMVEMEHAGNVDEVVEMVVGAPKVDDYMPQSYRCSKLLQARRGYCLLGWI